MRVYISGPVTGTRGYYKRFHAAEKALKKEGHTVVNPVKVNMMLPAGLTHEDYMKVSLTIQGMCDATLFLDGWRDSKGCGIEFEYAFEHKQNIFFEGGPQATDREENWWE